MTAKSDRVQKLVNDPDLAEAFESVRQYYRDLIEECPIDDDTALLDVRKMLHLLQDVRSHLMQAIQEGELEDFRSQEQQGYLEDLINGRSTHNAGN